MMKQTIKVEGMSCEHCKASVEREIAAVKGVESVVVDLCCGTATIEGEFSMDEVKSAVEEAGFEVGE